MSALEKELLRRFSKAPLGLVRTLLVVFTHGRIQVRL
jgi:hypothetical protein